MSSSNRNMTRGRTQPPPSGGASASSADFGEGLSSDIGDGATDDAEPESSAAAGEVNESISGSPVVLQKTKESFADNYSEELYGYKPSNQVRTERSCPVKVHAHTCFSSLNPDDEAVDFNGPTVNNKLMERIVLIILFLCVSVTRLHLMAHV
jgi:hypothetical protein